MPNYTHLAVQEPSTVTAYVATVQIARGSTNEQQELLCLADHSDSIGLVRVLASTPASTEYGLAVREIAPSTGPIAISSIAGVSVVSPNAGSTWATRPLQSSASDLQMTATPLAGSTWNVRPLQSSAADLQATVTPVAGSTWAVRPLQSSAADLQATVTPVAGSTWAVRPLQSSAADLQMTATPLSGSTWNVRPLQSTAGDLKTASWAFDSTGGGIIGSTKAVISTANGMIVRPATVDSTTFSARIATAGDNTIISSVAGVAIYVYAICVSAWNLAQSTGAGTAGSSGVLLRLQSGTTGANAWQYTYQTSTQFFFDNSIAVSPPNFLFKTAVAAALNCAATSTGAMLNVAAWKE